MRFRHILHALALTAVSAPAIGQSICAGFTDVPLPAFQGSCSAIEWLKNRQITTGCGTGVYCPAAPVTRESMALFLMRMGGKLTPAIIEPVPVSDSVTQLDLSPPGGVVRCQTGDFVIAADSYPRRAHFQGRMNLYNPSVSGQLITDMVYTVHDVGATPSTTWLQVPNTAHFLAMYQGPTFVPVHDVSTYPNGYMDLLVNKVYKFGMRVQRMTGTVSNVAVNCTNIVSIANRNGTASPFDGAEYTPPADAMLSQGRPYP